MMSSDVVGSLFMMESDGAAAQTPPVTEPHHHRSLSGAYVRHRKTASGFLDLDMEKLMEFPVEALSPDDVIDLSHLPHLGNQECPGTDVGKEISIDPAPNPTIGLSSAESDFDYGVDTMSSGPISWPATPSYGSHKGKTADDYEDSDQDTVIEDEEALSCDDDTDNEYVAVLRDWNMNVTLVDDESLGFPMAVDIYPDPCDISEDQLPDYVGLDPDCALVSIPEDVEVYLDKVGNLVLEQEKSLVRVSLESIEYDAGWSADDVGSGDSGSHSPDRIKAIDQQQRSNKTMRRPISHREAVEAIIDRGIPRNNKKSHQARNRHSKEDLADLFGPDANIEVACEVVIPNMDSLVKPSIAEGCQMLDVALADDVKVSPGCCAGFKRLPTFGKAKSRMEALGRALKKHWPFITSTFVPVVLFFSCRRQK